MTPTRTRCAVLPALALALALASCTGGPSVAEVAETYADILHAGYDDAHRGATTLDGSLRALTATPSEATLTMARDAWIARARRTCRPRSTASTTARSTIPTTAPRASINAWPLDESYID